MTLFLGLLSHYGYVALFFLVLLGGTYIPIPGGFALIAAGALSHHHYFSLTISFIVALSASVLEDVITYAITRWIGESRKWITFVEKNRYAGYIERSFKKRPRIAVVVSRFVGFTGMPVNALAGLSRMPLWEFIAFDALGNSICTALYLGAGYVLGLAWANDVQAAARDLSILFVIGTLAYLLFFFISYVRKSKVEKKDSV
jgi:membrane protein DedA with SNARE-associated domain